LFHLPGMNPGEDFAAYEVRLQNMARHRTTNEAQRIRTTGLVVKGR
jgi:hypothetical protein